MNAVYVGDAGDSLTGVLGEVGVNEAHAESQGFVVLLQPATERKKGIGFLWR